MKKYTRIQKMLAKKRMESGDSVKKVAWEAQVTENTVRNFENGKNKSLDLTVHYLINYVEEEEIINMVQNMYLGNGGNEDDV